jgi:hypothetical protein
MHVHLNVKQVILLGELEDGGRIRVAFFKTNHPHTNTHTHTHTTCVTQLFSGKSKISISVKKSTLRDTNSIHGCGHTG